ncbi:hypothetical protein FDG2_1449 [Candidatus Protofrankia californiensis]|uniref:FtsK domain-containing protein n=1 Tax=Candidatus Protofrankia californiensis TaxID=1839754 RepID=A0A1C3NVN3_9ACTN|nr:hypothetical protein FDG2_1449 [Candidatus Protofrankia californiensis]
MGTAPAWGFLATAGLWWLLRGRRTGWAPRRWLAAYTLTVAVAGAVWLAWTTTTHGPTRLPLAVLWAGGYALAVPYWRHHHIPNPIGPTPPAPEPDVAPEPPAIAEVHEQLPEVIDLWNKWVACKGGPAEGSQLADRESTADGEKYTVLLPRSGSRVSRRELQNRAYQIAHAMGMSAAQIRIDAHDDGEHLAYLLATLDRETAAASLTYPGPKDCYDPATGITYWGRWPDGERMPWTAFHPERGVFSGVILGGTGAGKSRLVEQLCATWLNTGFVTIWMIDPQDGSSLPTLAEYADWAVVGRDPKRLNAMMRGIDIVGETRTKNNAIARPRRKVHPLSPRTPVLIVVIDECHMIFDPNLVGPEQAAINANTVDRIARSYRKGGMGVLLASQDSGLKVFGGLDTLRANVVNYNSVVMRLTSNIAGGLIPGFGGDAKALPPHGYAYYNGATGSRDIHGRAFDAENDLPRYYREAPRVELETAIRRPLTEQLGTAYTRRHHALDDATTANATNLYGPVPDPSLIAEIAIDDPDLAAGLSQIAAARDVQPFLPDLGQTTTTDRPPAARTTTTGNTLLSAWTRQLGPTATDEPGEDFEPDRQAVDVLAFGAGLAAQARGEDPDEAMAAIRDALTGDATPTFPSGFKSLGTAAGRDIYQAIRDGADTPATIGIRAGYAESTVHRILKALLADKLIRKTRYGRYEANPAA